MLAKSAGVANAAAHHVELTQPVHVPVTAGLRRTRAALERCSDTQLARHASFGPKRTPLGEPRREIHLPACICPTKRCTRSKKRQTPINESLAPRRKSSRKPGKRNVLEQMAAEDVRTLASRIEGEGKLSEADIRGKTEAELVDHLVDCQERTFLEFAPRELSAEEGVDFAPAPLDVHPGEGGDVIRAANVKESLVIDEQPNFESKDRQNPSSSGVEEEDEDCEQSQQRTKKIVGRSWAWQWATSVKGQKPERAVCNTCNKEVSGAANALASHLTRTHHKEKQSTAPKRSRSKSTMSNFFKASSADLANEATNVIIIDVNASSMVEKPGHKNFCEKFSPELKTPSRRNVSGVLVAKFTLARKVTAAELSKVKGGSIALTTDGAGPPERRTSLRA
eukprot:jgi/Bigna1/137586/aug1.40_g12294